MSNLPAGVTDAMIEKEFYGDDAEPKNYWVTIQVRVPAHEESDAVYAVEQWLNKTTMLGVPLKKSEWQIDSAEKEE